jgi:hypothetical protein
MSNFEKENNHLLSRAIDLLKTKDVGKELGEIEVAYKKNIEDDVHHFVAHLPADQGKLLGDFQDLFGKFKKKIELVKASNLPLAQIMRTELDFFVFTILGLKPVSLIDKDHTQYYNWSAIEQLYATVNKSPLHDLSRGMFSYTTSKGLFFEYEYLLCTKPIISPLFVHSCYPHMEMTHGFVEELVKVMKSSDQELQKQFVTRCWTQQGKEIIKTPEAEFYPLENDLALMLGYVPTWYNKRVTTREDECLFNPEYSQHFRFIIIPGVLACKDRSPYVLLYEKLVEYALVGLDGLEFYLKTLEYILCINTSNPQMHQACKEKQDLALITKVIGQAIGQGSQKKQSWWESVWGFVSGAKKD